MYRLFFFACAVLAIAGCSQLGSVQNEELEQLWVEQQLASGQFSQWDMHARAVVRYNGGVYNIGIHWQRQAESFMMLLEAPFGRGVFRIRSESEGVYRLRLPDGQVFENNTAEELLENAIGWSIPISGLEYWIRGIPRPASEYSYHLSPGGRARSLKQDQWDIGYLDYFSLQQKPQLPRKIKLTNKKMAIRLVIERWQAETDTRPSELFPDFN